MISKAINKHAQDYSSDDIVARALASIADVEIATRQFLSNVDTFDDYSFTPLLAMPTYRVEGDLANSFDYVEQ